MIRFNMTGLLLIGRRFVLLFDIPVAQSGMPNARYPAFLIAGLLRRRKHLSWLVRRLATTSEEKCGLFLFDYSVLEQFRLENEHAPYRHLLTFLESSSDLQPLGQLAPRLHRA